MSEIQDAIRRAINYRPNDNTFVSRLEDTEQWLLDRVQDELDRTEPSRNTPLLIETWLDVQYARTSIKAGNFLHDLLDRRIADLTAKLKEAEEAVQ